MKASEVPAREPHCLRCAAIRRICRFYLRELAGLSLPVRSMPTRRLSDLEFCMAFGLEVSGWRVVILFLGNLDSIRFRISSATKGSTAESKHLSKVRQRLTRRVNDPR